MVLIPVLDEITLTTEEPVEFSVIESSQVTLPVTSIPVESIRSLSVSAEEPSAVERTI